MNTLALVVFVVCVLALAAATLAGLVCLIQEARNGKTYSSQKNARALLVGIALIAFISAFIWSGVTIGVFSE